MAKRATKEKTTTRKTIAKKATKKAKRPAKKATTKKPVKKRNAGDASETLEAGYMVDYVSGQPVRATPEEVKAVQVFSKRLVEDFGYPKTHIITRPQYRVRRGPDRLA